MTDQPYRPISVCRDLALVSIVLLADVRADVAARLAEPTTPRKTARKLEILLLLGLQASIPVIAKRLGCDARDIARCARRYLLSGVSGLLETNAAHRPKEFGPDAEEAVLTLVRRAPPPHLRRWTSREIGARLSIPAHVVRYMLKRNGISLRTIAT